MQCWDSGGVPELHQLHVKSGASYVKAPDWMLFFWQLGEILAGLGTGDAQRLVIATVVPTRTCAAPLVAASFCLKTYRPVNTRLYFNYLASLPKGTVLRRRRGDRWQYAVLHGTDVLRSGQRVLRVETARGRPPNGPVISIITEEQASSLYVSADKRDVQLPREEGVGQLLPAAERPGLLAYWFAPDDMYAYSMTVSYDCAIVGNLNALRQELLYDLFALPKGSGFVIGALQDLVRAKRLTGYGEGYRSRLLPYRDGKQIGHQAVSALNPKALNPKLVIFDGARAFLTWRFRFLQSHWLVILDRTEYDFLEGVAQVVADSGSGKQVRVGDIDLPAGIELLAYQEA